MRNHGGPAAALYLLALRLYGAHTRIFTGHKGERETDAGRQLMADSPPTTTAIRPRASPPRAVQVGSQLPPPLHCQNESPEEVGKGGKIDGNQARELWKNGIEKNTSFSYFLHWGSWYTIL